MIHEYSQIISQLPYAENKLKTSSRPLASTSMNTYLDQFVVQYQDFCDTEQITTRYDDLRFSLAPIQESKGDNNFDCCNAELVIGVEIHWLAGLHKMDAVITCLRNPRYTAKFKEYKKHLKQYVSKRVSNSKCAEFIVRTDCAWALEKSDIKDACAVIVDLLGIDAEGMEISGELARMSLIIRLKPPQHNEK